MQMKVIPAVYKSAGNLINGYSAYLGRVWFFCPSGYPLTPVNAQYAILANLFPCLKGFFPGFDAGIQGAYTKTQGFCLILPEAGMGEDR